MSTELIGNCGYTVGERGYFERINKAFGLSEVINFSVGYDYYNGIKNFCDKLSSIISEVYSDVRNNAKIMSFLDERDREETINIVEGLNEVCKMWARSCSDADRAKSILSLSASETRLKSGYKKNEIEKTARKVIRGSYSGVSSSEKIRLLEKAISSSVIRAANGNAEKLAYLLDIEQGKGDNFLFDVLFKCEYDANPRRYTGRNGKEICSRSYNSNILSEAFGNSTISSNSYGYSKKFSEILGKRFERVCKEMEDDIDKGIRNRDYILDSNGERMKTAIAQIEKVGMSCYSTTSMQMVPSEQGKNIIIINKGDSCTVTPDSRAFFWGTDNSSTNPVPNKYGYECNPAYAAPNPVNTEDFTGRGCSDIQEATTLDFSYEWNLYNWMEIEPWFINEQEKSIDFSTSNIPADAASPVEYLVELRDDEGNILPIPVTIYEDYSDAQHFIMMEQQGVVRQYAEHDSDDWWTEGGVRIPAGYDFRICALNNDQPIGVYVGGSEQLKSPGWDEEGFREAVEDLEAGQYIVEEYFMIPMDEIRIEKVATNAPADEEFVFTATKNYPYYNWVTYEKTETVQMPLNNYPYTLYSSADNTKIGNYKTSDTGNFTLKNGQYAIFKVWKNPDDFLDYKDNGSTYWEGYKKWKENGDPMPDSSVYTFREQEIPGCVTTVEHVTKDGSNTVKGTYVDNVNNGDSLVFRNAFQDTSAASGSLTISKKVTDTGTPDADTLFEFTVTKDKTAAVGQYSVDGGTVQTISADGKISLKAGQNAVLTGLEPGEYTVTETSPTQANYKTTSFSVNNGEVQNGLSATVTVTGAAAAAGGWSKKDGMPVQDADGYFTYTITSDQIDADGKITVDCDLLAEYIEAQMQKYQNLSACNFKVKFVNETGAPIQYQDYHFDTVNWIPVGGTYTPSDTPSMGEPVWIRLGRCMEEGVSLRSRTDADCRFSQCEGL